MTRACAWLVTGGAGYIGGHTVARLRESGHRVVVLDDLSTGVRDRVPADVPLFEASVLDTATVTRVLREQDIEGVIHFAGKKSVPESVADPLLYYQHNIGGTSSVLAAMLHAGTKNLIYSSSAAVYGMPSSAVVSEDAPAVPINPYGHTKLVCEQMIAAVGQAHGISWLVLRYFNAVGAEEPELADSGGSNLFPLMFDAVSQGRPLIVTGADFDTSDGTGVRDYVHVGDLADAHVAAAERLIRGPAGQVLNVGTGRGYTVLEVLHALEKVTGQHVPYVVGSRREGDAAHVIAAVDRIAAELGWTAKRGLDEMVASAWAARQPGSGSGADRGEALGGTG